MSIKKVAKMGVLQLKKYSPEILLAVGVVGIVGTVVLSVKASKKIDGILEDFEGKKPVVNVIEGEGVELGELHPEDKKDLVIKVTLAAAPAVGVGALSVGCILASYGIVNHRLVVVSGLLGTTTEKFANYRQRVKDEYGEEIEQKIYTKVKEKREGVNKKGEPIIEDFEVLDSDVTGGAFRFFYDNGSSQFTSGDGLYNKLFLESKEEMFNRLLRRDGYVFLNDILRSLDLPVIPAGQLVGWTDNGFDIDFGLRKDDNYDECVTLDFNVHGYIYNQI